MVRWFTNPLVYQVGLQIGIARSPIFGDLEIWLPQKTPSVSGKNSHGQCIIYIIYMYIYHISYIYISYIYIYMYISYISNISLTVSKCIQVSKLCCPCQSFASMISMWCIGYRTVTCFPSYSLLSWWPAMDGQSRVRTVVHPMPGEC